MQTRSPIILHQNGGSGTDGHSTDILETHIGVQGLKDVCTSDKWAVISGMNKQIAYTPAPSHYGGPQHRK